MAHKVILFHIILLHTLSVLLRESSRDSNVVLEKTLLINHTFQLVFSAKTVFFSHNKSANSVFQPAYEHSRTGPLSTDWAASASLPWLLPSSGNPAAACTTTFLPIVIMDSYLLTYNVNLMYFGIVWPEKITQEFSLRLEKIGRACRTPPMTMSSSVFASRYLCMWCSIAIIRSYANMNIALLTPLIKLEVVFNGELSQLSWLGSS
jgi:hypothetical protein